MQLSPEEVDQFYKLMMPLLFSVTQNSDVAPEITTWEEFIAADLEVKTEARDELYKRRELFDAFIESKSQSLSAEELQTVRSWRASHVAGTFLVERHLKKHSIWIHSDPDSQLESVYAVQGLGTPLEDIIPKSRLPLMVNTGILPFKGRIVCDGLVRHYNISFGSGSRAGMRESYMIAKQNGTIIEQLDAQTGEGISPPPTADPSRDWSEEVAALKKSAAKLKGEKHPLTREAFTICLKSIELVEATTTAPDDLESIVNQFDKLTRALRKLQTAIDRTR